jgi:hypothetical protein
MNVAIAIAGTLFVCTLFYGFFQAGVRHGRIDAVNRITAAVNSKLLHHVSRVTQQQDTPISVN